MIKGIGTDIVKLSRIKISNTAFLSQEELEIFNKLTERKQQQFLAGRWAVKEAIFKAWKDCPYNFNEISIIYNKYQQPFVKKNPRLFVSISHENDYAIAFVIYTQ